VGGDGGGGASNSNVSPHSGFSPPPLTVCVRALHVSAASAAAPVTSMTTNGSTALFLAGGLQRFGLPGESGRPPPPLPSDANSDLRLDRLVDRMSERSISPGSGGGRSWPLSTDTRSSNGAGANAAAADAPQSSRGGLSTQPHPPLAANLPWLIHTARSCAW